MPEIYILIDPEKIPNRVFPDLEESHDCYSDGFIDGKQAVLSHAKKIDVDALTFDWADKHTRNTGKDDITVCVPFSEFLQSKLKGG